MAVGGGEVDQPVRVERVAAAGEVEAELEAFAPPPARSSPRAAPAARSRLIPYLAASRSAAVPSTVARRRRIELEAAPHHGHLVAVLERLQRRFEAPLADVAPRADDVGPDFDRERHRPKLSTCSSEPARCVKPDHPPARPLRPDRRRRHRAEPVRAPGPARAAERERDRRAPPAARHRARAGGDVHGHDRRAGDGGRRRRARRLAAARPGDRRAGAVRARGRDPEPRRPARGAAEPARALRARRAAAAASGRACWSAPRSGFVYAPCAGSGARRRHLASAPPPAAPS